MSQIDFDAIDKDLQPELEQRNKILDSINHDLMKIKDRIGKLNPSFLFIYTFNVEDSEPGRYREESLVWMHDRMSKKMAIMYAVFNKPESDHKSKHLENLIFAQSTTASCPWHIRFKIKDHLEGFYKSFVKIYTDNLNKTDVKPVIYVNGCDND